MTDPIIFQTSTEADFYSTILEDLLLSIKESLSQSRECIIGLSGGTTPRQLYHLLSAENLPWEKIIIITIDERYVPSDHPESNLKMIRSELLNHIAIPPENLIAFDTSLPILSAAKEMSRKLTALNRSPLFDILILGVGDDGHIASLFDNDTAHSSAHYADVATAKGYPTEQRLTLTMIPILSSKKIFILLKGDKKKQIFEEIKSGQTKHHALAEIITKEFVKVYFFN